MSDGIVIPEDDGEFLDADALDCVDRLPKPGRQAMVAAAKRLVAASRAEGCRGDEPAVAECRGFADQMWHQLGALRQHRYFMQGGGGAADMPLLQGCDLDALIVGSASRAQIPHKPGTEVNLQNDRATPPEL